MRTSTTLTSVIETDVRRFVMWEYRLVDTARNSAGGGTEYAVLRVITQYEPNRGYISSVRRAVSGENAGSVVNEGQLNDLIGTRITTWTGEYSARGLENAFGKFVEDRFLEIQDAIEWACGALD